MEKMQDKCKRYETKMDSIVEEKVGETIKEKNAALERARTIEEEMADSGNVIEKLKRQLDKKKEEIQEQKEKLDANKEEMQQNKYTNRALEKKLAASKRQCDDKLVELDKLYAENDFLKGELAKIRDKYDFSVIDQTKASLDRHEAWAAKVMATTVKTTNTYESYY